MHFLNDFMKRWLFNLQKISFAHTVLLFTCFSPGLDCEFVLSFSLSASYKYVQRVITLK